MVALTDWSNEVDMMAESPTSESVNDPAVVQGSECRGIAWFVIDEHEQLVDIEYTCYLCWLITLKNDVPLWLPGYSWPDYDVHCNVCSELINKGRETE